MVAPMLARQSINNALRGAERYGGAASCFRETMAISLDDVLRQMQEAGVGGLSAEELRIDGGYHRFKPEGERKKKKSGWYKFFSIVTKSGREVIVGAYGRGPDTFKVRPSQSEWTLEEREEFKRKHAERQRELDKERAGHADDAAARAQKLWDRFKDRIGAAPYLRKKNVKPFGVRFGPRGAVIVPVRNAAGDLRAIQWIDEEGAKRFTTGAEISGNFHLIGQPSDDGWLLIGEGYATCASVHMATGLPIAVAFDAGNLAKVAAVLRPLYPKAKFLFVGDDDRHLLPRLDKQLAKYGVSERTPADGQPHTITTASGPVAVCWRWENDPAMVPQIELSIDAAGNAQSIKIQNTGRAKASEAAKKFKGRMVFPMFAQADALGTDFNDLHVAQGSDEVGRQIKAALDAPLMKKTQQPPPDDGVRFQYMLRNWVLLSGTKLIWDEQRWLSFEADALKLDVTDLPFKQWRLHPQRRTIKHENMVFEPGRSYDPNEYINLFNGFELKPDPSKCCERLKLHLQNMCGKHPGQFEWVVRWLAYPLQHPGAKMHTALLLFGAREGTGKSFFFANVMQQIYGRYSRIITQLQLQDKYTDWLSQMLYCVAEEVVSYQERRHHKGLLKNLITTPTIYINGKWRYQRDETNHANFVFLSNELVPLVVDEHDRRYTVINYDDEHDNDYFVALGEEVKAGGAQGLLHWLLAYPLGDFKPWTRPLPSSERKQLIGLGMTPEQRFYALWSSGQLDLSYIPCCASDLYEGFRIWAQINGERYPPNSTIFGTAIGRKEFKRIREIQIFNEETNKFEDKQPMIIFARSKNAVAEQPLTKAELSDSCAKFRAEVYFLRNQLRKD